MKVPDLGVFEGHDLSLNTSPVWVKADEPRIHQIVSNVVSNAVKYTPAQGCIDIRVFRRGDHAGQGQAAVQHVFEPALTPPLTCGFMQFPFGLFQNRKLLE